MAVKRSVNKSVLLSEFEAKLLRDVAYHGEFKHESDVLRQALYQYAMLFEAQNRKGIFESNLNEDGMFVVWDGMSDPQEVLGRLEGMLKFQKAKEEALKAKGGE